MTIQRYSEVKAGYETNADFSIGPPRTVAVPDGLPEARRQLYIRLAWWHDPMLLAWLNHLPVFEDKTWVVLSEENVIHRGNAEAWECGQSPAAGGSLGHAMTLAMATATQITEEGKRVGPKPCVTCWPTGLLVERSG